LIINQSVCRLLELNIGEVIYPQGLNELNTKICVALSVLRIILTTVPEFLITIKAVGAFMNFQIFMQVKIQIGVVWVLPPCRLV
jgi:hypothetical protein